MRIIILVLGVAIIFTNQLLAQNDEIKQKIMEKVRNRLEQERKAILFRLEQIMDEELGLRKSKVKEKIAELERELDKVLQKKEELEYAIMELKWWDRDEKLVEQAQEEGPTTQEEFSKAFKEAIDNLTAKKIDESITGFKLLFYRFAGAQVNISSCAYNIACGYSLSERKQDALDWLEISVRRGFMQLEDQCHSSMLAHLEKDTDLDNIRNEPRYQRLVESFKE